ncbi:MAG: hypothetical protein KDB02_08355 [Acidimicrobiales bacterium]|nr:hypothetical protein [Acidimicrobiales bacterium]
MQAIAPAQPASGRVDEVRLAVPAEPEYAHVVRLTVTAVAARIGFDYDEIEDLRIAVGEMCGILVLDEPGARLTVRCSATDAEVTVEASREPASPTITVGELSDQILRAVVDTFAVDPDEARVTITKHRQG